MPRRLLPALLPPAAPSEKFARYTALHKRSALLRQLARVQLPVINNFRFAPLADATVRDLLEVLDDQYGRASTLITSQLAE